jgi:hypothetical protein
MPELIVYLPAVAFNAQAKSRGDATALLKDLADAYRILARKIRVGRFSFMADPECTQGALLENEPLAKTVNHVPDQALRTFLFTFLVNKGLQAAASSTQVLWAWDGQTPTGGLARQLHPVVKEPGMVSNWLVTRLSAAMPSSNVSVVTIDGMQARCRVCWNEQTALEWVPKFEANDKHKFEADADVRDARYVSPMDLDLEDAQRALDASVSIKRRRYFVDGNACYVFHAHRPEASPQLFHGFKVAVEHLVDHLRAALRKEQGLG